MYHQLNKYLVDVENSTITSIVNCYMYIKLF